MDNINLERMRKTEIVDFAFEEFGLALSPSNTKRQLIEELDEFGWEKKLENNKAKELPSVVPAQDQDGGDYIVAGAGRQNTFIDLDGDKAQNDREQIRKYRTTAAHPEVENAIEDIVNEAISGDDQVVEIDLQSVEASESIKTKIKEEFDGIVNMLNFRTFGHDIFRTWYVDGRIYHHLVIDPANPKKGIQEMRPIDATRIRKVKEVEKEKVPGKNIEVIKSVKEYFVFEDDKKQVFQGGDNNKNAVKIAPEAISYVTSGVMDPTRKRVLSHLHKAIIPSNQLRMMENSLVIYRLVRSPERRIFYIDVSGMGPKRAETYVQSMMNRYRNKLVYNAETGTIDSQSKHMTMQDDFWVPQREGRGTQVDTLQGGENLGQIDDVLYFKKALYHSLNVPVARLDPEQAAAVFGSASEVTRDEFKFQKWIERLRVRFQELFLDTLRKQLILKGIATQDDWAKWKGDIVVDFISSNYFTELKETEMWQRRFAMLRDVEDYVGKYVSKAWVRSNVLRLTEDAVKTIDKEIKSEIASGEIDKPEDDKEDSGF